MNPLTNPAMYAWGARANPRSPLWLVVDSTDSSRLVHPTVDHNIASLFATTGSAVLVVGHFSSALARHFIGTVPSWVKR